MKKGSLALFLTLLLALLGAGVSALTIIEHLLLEISEETGLTLESGLCTIGATFNCKKVIGSEWSLILGIPLGYFGVAFYLLLFALTVAAFDEKFVGRTLAGATLFTMSLLASVFSVYLYLVSELKIGALCPLCLTTYGINFLLLISTYLICPSVSLRERRKLGIAGLVRYPLLLLRIGAPRESSAPTIARIWLVAGLLAVFFIGALPDFIASQFVIPTVERASDSERLAKGVESWSKSPVQKIALSLDGGLQGDHFKGSPQAPVVIVEFSDFECPACRGTHIALEAVLKEFEASIVFVHKDYPLDHACNSNISKPFHRMACFAAEVARCAGEQGKFFETADFLYKSPILTRRSNLKKSKEDVFLSSEVLGLDEQGLRECVASRRHRPKIKGDIAAGDTLELAGTPSIWVNGKKLQVIHPTVLRAVISEILGDLPAQG